MIEYKGLYLSQIGEHLEFVESDMNEYFKMYSYHIPQDYREFLKITNGGNILYANNDALVTCQINGKSIKIPIYVFYPFQKKFSLTCQPTIWKPRNHKRPSFLYEIVGLVEDEYIYIGISEPLLGKVVFIDSKKSNLKKSSTEQDVLNSKAVTVLANSFNEFFENIEIIQR
jgi:hypothetical protein